MRLKITQVPITLYLCVIICRIIAHKFTQVSITLYFNTDSNPLKFTIMNNDLEFFPFLELNMAFIELQYPGAQKLFANKFANISFDTIQWTNAVRHSCTCFCGLLDLVSSWCHATWCWCQEELELVLVLVLSSARAGAGDSRC